jgi:hypothetical protein
MNPNDNLDTELTPSWLIEILEQVHVTDSTLARMRGAGKAAYAIASMRAEKEKVGFVPLPLNDYLKELANMAGVSLAAVLKASGIEDMARPNAFNAEKIGRLGHALGFRLDELLLNLRVAFAEQAAGNCLPMLAARRGVSGVSHLPECGRLLDQLQLRWPPDLRMELDAVRSAVASGYRESAREELEVVR